MAWLDGLAGFFVLIHYFRVDGFFAGSGSGAASSIASHDGICALPSPSSLDALASFKEELDVVSICFHLFQMACKFEPKLQLFNLAFFWECRHFGLVYFVIEYGTRNPV